MKISEPALGGPFQHALAFMQADEYGCGAIAALTLLD
jgi:hypothetical protein